VEHSLREPRLGGGIAASAYREPALPLFLLFLQQIIS
jgi:hypothetical protein